MMRGAPTAAAAARLAVLAGAMMITAAAFQLCHPPKQRRIGMFVGSPPSWLPPQRLQLLLPHQPTARTTPVHPTRSNLARGGGRSSLRARWPFGGGGDKEKEGEDAGVVGGSSGGSDDGSAAAQDRTAVRETPLPPPIAAAPNPVEVASKAEESVISNAGGGGGGGEGAGVAVTTTKTRRAGTKSMAAARAAVAVMERIEEQEQKQAGGGEGEGVSARRRRAKTTREEMFNICVQDGNMTETEGMAAVQTYVYALAATPLVSQKDKEDLMLAVDEKRSAMLSKNETSSLAAEETAKAIAATATATGTYKSEWYEEEPPSVYDDDLLRDLGNRFPLVAKEVDEVLLSKPESTGFSSRVLTGFREWITFTPKIMEMAEKTPLGALTTAKIVGARTAFSVVADVLRADTVELANGGRGRGEADSVIRQMQANAAEALLSGGMGFQKRRLVVPDEDVELFVEQVLAGLVVVGETLTTPIGFRLIRCNYVKSSADAAELSRTVKSRMAEIGLDAKVAAFLTWDVIGAFDSMENMGREIEDLESQAAMMGDDDEQLAKVFNTVGAGLSLMGPQDEKMFVLIPAETKPNEDTQANEQGRTALALGAPITLFTFLGDVFVFNGSPYEMANGAVDGDVQLLTQIGLLGLIMAGLLLSRDIARTVAAKLVGVELEAPVLLPSFETGLLATKRPVASFPSTSQDLFDVAIAGPTVGFATAAAALVMGLQMTAAAGPDVLAGFPSLPSSLLQCSSLVGSVVDYFLHTSLAVQDLAVERVAMHPLAVGGVAGMLWTAATVLPLPGSDGEAVIDTLDTNFKYNAIVTPLAYLFAVSQIIGGGMFLLSVLLVNFIAYPESAPLMREDNVTPVRSPARLALGVIVAAVSLAVLSPMTISSFLTGGPLSMDTGAGAESVAAGLGVGGIGFHGFL